MAKQTTTTTLIIDAFKRADDFLTASQLIEITGRNMNRVSAALHHLRIHKVVEPMAVDRMLYWYHTPATDTRTRVFDEKKEEIRPRKPRKIKSTP